jgi:hypothetical protein
LLGVPILLKDNIDASLKAMAASFVRTTLQADKNKIQER